MKMRRMCRGIMAGVALLALTVAAGDGPAERVKVACIGDSITYGYGLADRDHESYPAQLQKLLDAQEPGRYEVRNFGNSGRGIYLDSMRGDEKRGYRWMAEHKAALDWKPDIVICNLGINDCGEYIKEYTGGRKRGQFVDDYAALLGDYRDANPQAKFFMWTKLSPLAEGQKFYRSPEPFLMQTDLEVVASRLGATGIDMQEPLREKMDEILARDKIHPNAEGARLIAEATFKALTGGAGGQPIPRLVTKMRVETWLCAGQSNMQKGWGEFNATPAEKERVRKELARLDRVDVRFWDFNTGEWTKLTRENALAKSAFGVSFAIRRAEAIHGQVRLLYVAAGGAPTESFLSEQTMCAVGKDGKPLYPHLAAIATNRHRLDQNKDFPCAWVAREYPRRRTNTEEAYWWPVSKMYDNGIARIRESGLSLDGILWYQGESNATTCVAPDTPTDRDYQRETLRALISELSTLNSPLSTLHSQLSTLLVVGLPKMNRPWEQYRAVQREVCDETGATFVDTFAAGLGDAHDVHPRDKAAFADLAARAAAAAFRTRATRAATTRPLGDGWTFSRDGADWTPVRVPHDWAIQGPFDKQHDIQVVAIKEDGEKKANEKTGRTGALPWIGRGIYRRTVELPADVTRAALVFSGAMSEPEIFWDGEKAGEWKWGYTSFKVDLPRPTPGAHELEVRLTNRPESSRWYPGAGLYRPVYLVLNADDAEAAVFARPEKRAALPKIEVSEKGFFVNGERVTFKGVCLHHDLGSIGAEWNASAFRRQVRLLKEIGVNAIRTSHNQPNPELLDICDEEGIYVMAESFDAWRRVKVKNGYNLWYDAWWKRDLAQLVKVCRDHPCVVMYSLGNEIWESVCPEGPAMLREMQDYLHALDPSRPCTLGNNRPLYAGKIGTQAVQDIAGANYHIYEYEATRPYARHGVILGTETASAISTRGFYRFPDVVRKYRDAPDGDGCVSSYDTDEIDWSNLADDDFAAQEDWDWALGQFVWTGFDYLGEPSPYNLYWPSRSSYFGIYDLAGLPKDRAALYRSVWRPDVRTLHILPHWTWPGRAGETTPVYVYTDAPEAELFVNGVSQGRRAKDRASRLDRYRLRWREVKYEPGELKAVAFYPDGTTRTAVVRTAGAPAALRLAIDRPRIGLANADGTRELAYVTVEVVDAAGTVCPDAALPLSFAVTGGAARFKAACNGDPTSLEVFTEPHMTTFHGALVVTLAAEKEGAATLTVTADGLPPATIGLAVAPSAR